MKTIEEINEIAPYHPLEWQQGYGIWQAGYMEGQKNGAVEQKAIDDTELAKLKKELLLATTFAVKAKEKEVVDKACEWLMKYFVIDHEGMSPSERDVFLRKFRKAMGDE